jgi:hypothetical protein
VGYVAGSGAVVVLSSLGATSLLYKIGVQHQSRVRSLLCALNCGANARHAADQRQYHGTGQHAGDTVQHRCS